MNTLFFCMQVVLVVWVEVMFQVMVLEVGLAMVAKVGVDVITIIVLMEALHMETQSFLVNLVVEVDMKLLVQLQVVVS